MLYEIGQYAWPALNAFGYSMAYAVVVLSSAAVYAIYKVMNQ